jgi:hypothetical protein
MQARPSREAEAVCRGRGYSGPMAAIPGAKPNFRSKLTPEEKLELTEMVVTGSLTHRQAAQAWNQRRPEEKHVSHATVGRIVKAALEQTASDLGNVVSAYRIRQDTQLTQAIRVAWTIALGSKCSVCSGEKTIREDKLDPDSAVIVCPKCEGSGRNEADAVRLQALNTVKGLLERQAKLFGLDAPVQLEQSVTASVALDVQQLSDEALKTELAQMLRAPGSVVDGTAVELDPGPAAVEAGADADALAALERASRALEGTEAPDDDLLPPGPAQGGAS